MAQGYQLIQSQTLSSAAASVTFSNIPQNFTDLVVKVSARAVGVDNQLTFNGSTTSHTSRYLFSSGTATSSGYDANNIQLQGTSQTSFAANAFGSIDIYIPNYTASSNKSISVESVTGNNTTESYQYFGAGIWSSSAAITSMTITNSSGNYTQHSTFQLYGIGGTRATGGTITADGNYTYHTFTSTGSFIPAEKIRNAEVLLVAGGGGGGSLDGGGGGAGGVISTIGQTLFAGTSYTALVGAGGAGGVSGASGSSGGNSQFALSITAVGGGAGGSSGDSGLLGGSGGGGSYAGSGGGATYGQGNAGGLGVLPGGTYGSGGGGGGAGTAGTAGAAGFAGAGGNGTNAYQSWHYATSTGVNLSGSYFIAGGGGGGGDTRGSVAGIGGIGGGGAGSTTVTASSATANTGGGGGAGGYDYATKNGGAGGSGIVIIRYPNN